MKKNYLSSLWLLLAFLCPFVSTAQLYDPVFNPTHVYKIVNQYNGNALGVSGNRDEILSEGRKMDAGTYWGLAKQQWYIESLATGIYKITNRNSGKVLTGDGVFVSQTGFSNKSGQKWNIARAASNTGYALSELRGGGYPSGNCLTTYPTATSIELQWYDGSKSTRWDIVDVSTDVGVYTIKNLQSNKALEVGGADLNPGAGINQWPYFGAASQQWILQPASNGYFSIVNRNSGYSLEMGGSYSESVSPGRVANQWSYWGNDNQQWSLLDVNNSRQLTLAEASDGRPVKLYNRRSGKVLEIGGNSADQYRDGRQANQWYDWSGPNQQWVIQFVSPN